MNKKKVKNIILNLIIILLSLILTLLLVKLYLTKLDENVKKRTETTNETFIHKESLEAQHGFLLANINEELDEYVGSNKKIETVEYKIEGETFSLLLSITRENNKKEYTIYKLVDTTRNINARMHYTNIKKIEYRSGFNNSTVIKIFTVFEEKYLAMTQDGYYFLGEDIDLINYENERFFYVTYNPKYKVINEENSCKKDIIELIDEFDENEYYYRYGRINFMKDYYQKNSVTKTLSVKDKCRELK